MAAAKISVIALQNGRSIPQFGLGTWQSKTGEVCDAVKVAIDLGYRHIDCALIYGNENEVGEALAAKINDGTVTREELFVTSKLWNTFHRGDLVKKSLKESLDKLGLSYLDLYLIHSPSAFLEGKDFFPKDVSGNVIFSDVNFLETWKALEECVDEGLVRSLGLSNFNHKQIQRVLDNCRIKPVNLQVELSPYLTQEKLVAFCLERGISVTAYSPLGSPDRPWAKPDEPVLLEDPTLKQIAKRVGKSTAQVLLRFGLQRNTIVIPKSVNQSRMKENIEVFDFVLSEEDMKAIASFNRNYRAFAFNSVSDHRDYPFHEEY